MSLLKFFKKQGSASSNDPSHDDLPCTSSSSSNSSSSSSTNTCSVVNIEVSQECESTSDAVTDLTSLARVRILPPKPNQPKINFPKSVFGTQRRGFSTTWYENYPWLHYILEEDAVLCFYCASAVQHKMLHSNVGLEVRDLNGGAKLKDIVAFLQSLNSVECELYTEVIKLTKINLVMPATNATRERSFSALRRLKTWLRSTMNQARLNWCMIQHIHQDQTDLLDIQSVANEFVGRNASRHSMFGVFV